MDIGISVVIPAYNCREHLARAVDSVLAQSFTPAQIIVVDDGSTDGTETIAKGYGDKIEYIRQENAGASAARNTGIEAASSEWIAFLDCDDEWLIDRLKLQVDIIERNPELEWVTGNFYRCYCDEDDRQALDIETDTAKQKLGGKEFADSFFKAFLDHTIGWTGTMLMKRKLLIEAGMFRIGQKRINDEDMWFRLAYIQPKIGYAVQPLGIYHMHVQGSIHKTHTDPMIICEFIERHLKMAEQSDKKQDFLPCANRLAKIWIHPCWQDQRVYEIREMLNQLGSVLETRYKFMVRVLTIWPGVTMRCMPIFRKINKLLKLPL